MATLAYRDILQTQTQNANQHSKNKSGSGHRITLLNKSNWHKVFSLLVGESSADSWEASLIHVTVTVIVLQSINPMIANAGHVFIRLGKNLNIVM